MYLQPSNQKSAGELLNGVLWADMKKCLLLRRPEPADVKDPSHVAAAKGHARAAYEKCIEDFEKLPFEHPEEKKDVFDRPAVAFTED